MNAGIAQPAPLPLKAGKMKNRKNVEREIGRGEQLKGQPGKPHGGIPFVSAIRIFLKFLQISIYFNL